MRDMIVMTLLSFVISLGAYGQGDGNLQVREDDGGTVMLRTASGYLNQDSSLKRAWYVIDDLNCPVRLERAGVFPRLDEKENVQDLVPIGTVAPKQAISAVEVRYALFDIWGDRLRTLAVTRLADSSTHVDLRTGTYWPVLESEASQLVIVAAFVRRVRLADGQMWNFDADRMAARMQALGLKVTADDLVAEDHDPLDSTLVYLSTAMRQKELSIKAEGAGHPKE